MSRYTHRYTLILTLGIDLFGVLKFNKAEIMGGKTMFYCITI